MQHQRLFLRVTGLVCLAAAGLAAAGCNESMRRDVRSAAYELFQAGVSTLFDELTSDVTTGIRDLSAQAAEAVSTAADAETAAQRRR